MIFNPYSFFPARYIPAPQPIKYEQLVFIKWLEIEVDRDHEMPVLQSLSHWRNRDVWHWVKDHREEYYVRYAA